MKMNADSTVTANQYSIYLRNGPSGRLIFCVNWSVSLSDQFFSIEALSGDCRNADVTSVCNPPLDHRAIFVVHANRLNKMEMPRSPQVGLTLEWKVLIEPASIN